MRARVEAIVTMAPRLVRSGFSAARANRERSRQIDVQHPPPFRVSQFGDRLADHYAGIGNKGVEPAEPPQRQAHRALGGARIGDIAGDRQHVGRAVAPGPEQGAFVLIDQRQAPAVVRQLRSDGASDTAGRAGDQRDFTRRDLTRRDLMRRILHGRLFGFFSWSRSRPSAGVTLAWPAR